MALQGTLDTFALPDVLRLLGGTGKTGRLRVNGDRGSGSVWVTDGQIVATESVGANIEAVSTVDTVFSMLRFASGSFTFENDATTSAASTPESVENVLGQAELLLSEWLTIAEVVPSLDAWAGLRQELVGRDVVIDSDRWRVIVAIGSGASVGQIGAALDLSELPACRAVKELVDLQLVEIGDAPEQLPPPPATAHESTDMVPAVDAYEPPEVIDTYSAAAPAYETSDAIEIVEPEYHEIEAVEPAPIGQVVFDDAAAAEDAEIMGNDSSSDSDFGFGLLPTESWSSDPSPQNDRGPVGFDSLAIDDVAPEPTSILAGSAADTGEIDPSEMARQLANLSPKAAKAVAAAAKASTAAERDAALAAVEAEDDSVDRGLLLKFLGTVDG